MEEESINPYDEAFNFPERLLDQISECSPEGFLLFVINEQGEVELFTKPVADVIEAGLRTKALKILNTLNMVEDSELASQFLQDQIEGDKTPEEIKEDEDENPEDWQK